MLCQKAQCQLLNYQPAQHTAISTTTSASCIQRWQPPPLNAIKLNWDIALNFSSHIAGLGGIAQNESSQVLASFCFKIEDVSNPVVVKALSFRKTLFCCVDLGFNVLILERNCEGVVNWSTSFFEPP